MLARVLGFGASSFSRAAKSNFSPFAIAVVISRPIVTWRNSSRILRESGCGFHPSLSSGNCVSLAIVRILLCRFFQVLTITCSYVGGGFGVVVCANADQPKTSTISVASAERRFMTNLHQAH